MCSIAADSAGRQESILPLLDDRPSDTRQDIKATRRQNPPIIMRQPSCCRDQQSVRYTPPYSAPQTSTRGRQPTGSDTRIRIGKNTHTTRSLQHSWRPHASRCSTIQRARSARPLARHFKLSVSQNQRPYPCPFAQHARDKRPLDTSWGKYHEAASPHARLSFPRPCDVGIADARMPIIVQVHSRLGAKLPVCPQCLPTSILTGTAGRSCCSHVPWSRRQWRRRSRCALRSTAIVS